MAEQTTIPKLRVQRMGKKWRIAYDDTRTLALYGNGDPLDGGGFDDEWQDGRKVVDGQQAAQICLSKITDGMIMQDAEEEGIC